MPWGDFNRIQRRHWSGDEPFDDDAPSYGVPGGPGRLGAIFVFNAVPEEGQKRRYGRHGNSYVSLVEFGDPVRAKSVMFFGQSGDPESPHYFDQAELYSRGEFKDAWFDTDEVYANRACITWPISDRVEER